MRIDVTISCMCMCILCQSMYIMAQMYFLGVLSTAIVTGVEEKLMVGGQLASSEEGSVDEVPEHPSDGVEAGTGAG